MFDAFAENDRILFLVLSGNNGCHCAVHLFRPYFTTSMFVWLPGTALVTTALCWLPGRCWSYSQYSLEICYATQCFWYWRRYINSWRFWHLVFGIRNLVSDLEFIVGIRNSVWSFRKCLESLWNCNTISRSLSREDIDCVFEWRVVVSRRIEHRAGRMLIVLVQDTTAMTVSDY